MSRLVVLLLAGILAVTFVNAAITHNGEPGCKTNEEIQVRKYRNNWDPTKYWLCSQINDPATLEPCPNERLFSTERKDCILAGDWAWTEPIEPPSRPE